MKAKGRTMITVEVDFWTDVTEKGGMIPKHAWTAGTVRVKPNARHGIKAQKVVHFHTRMELAAAIETALIRSGITLHRSRVERKTA